MVRPVLFLKQSNLLVNLNYYQGSHQGVCHPKIFLMFRIDLLLLNVFIALGGILPPEEVKERFDSNCITPVSDLALNQQLSVSVWWLNLFSSVPF